MAEPRIPCTKRQRKLCKRRAYPFKVHSTRVYPCATFQSMVSVCLLNCCKPELQGSLNVEGYDQGAKILTDYFKQELKQFLQPELHETGKKIIEAYLDDQPLQVFEDLL